MSNLPLAAEAPVTVIGASERPSGSWAEVWDYRELLYFLVWRDVKVRYKQTVLGIAWAVVQPVATMVVFSVVFGRLASMPSDGIPYPLFSLAALVPWTYFASAITQGASSLVGSQHLVAKVYFPRLLVPLSSVVTPLVDGAIALVILALLMVWYGAWVDVAVLAIPFFIALALASAFAASLWLAALNVQFRDVRFVMPFLVQFWLFVTPVAYPASLISLFWRPFYAINPMVTVVDGFRWSLLGAPAPPVEAVVVSCVMVALLIAGGLRYFRRTQGLFADVI